MRIACRCSLLCGSKSIFELVREPVLILYLYRQLTKSWPRGAHWFCPKRRDDDPLNYDDPDVYDAEAEEEHVTSAQKAKLIDDGDERLKIAYELFELHIFEIVDMGDALVDAKMDHRSRTLDLLTTCDRCVRNYHMGRKPFLKEFSE
jgi:senataxin